MFVPKRPVSVEFEEAYNHQRRHADRSMAKRLYDAGTPYIQIVFALISTAFLCGGIWSDVRASLTDVKELKLWKESASIDIATMREDVHAIRDILSGNGKNVR